MRAATKMLNGERVELATEEGRAIEAGWSANDRLAQEEEARRAATAYREDRKNAYIEKLGVQPELTETLGDVLDVIVKKIRAMDANNTIPHAEFDAMVEEIDRIKIAYPKPPER